MSCKYLIPIFSFGALAHAGVTGITNGDFEADAGVARMDQPVSVTAWYEQSVGPALWSEWVAKSDVSSIFAGNQSAILGFTGGNGYVYQQIGTYTAGESLTLTGQVLQRNAAGSPNNGFAVELLAGDFGGAADGTPLVATLLDTQSLSREQLTSAPYGFGTGTSHSAGFMFTLQSGNSGVDGAALWLRILPLSSLGEVFLDNLVVSAVPEPSAYGLMGAGVLALAVGVRRRRRR